MGSEETLTDTRYKTLELSIEVESNLPIFANDTVVSTDNIIKHYQHNITTTKDALIEKISIKR